MTANRVLASSIVCLMSALTTMGTAESQAAALYVSLSGDDSNAGTKAKPFATLQHARDEVRKLKQLGPLERQLTVFIRGGVYRITDTLRLTEADSGTERLPLIWQAAPGEVVRFIGGARLTAFKPVTDPAILARLAPGARSHVLEIDLRAAGLEDFGSVASVDGTRADLICNHRYMTLARYPNTGDWSRISAVPEGGTRHEYEKVVYYGRFTYQGERPVAW